MENLKIEKVEQVDLIIRKVNRELGEQYGDMDAASDPYWAEEEGIYQASLTDEEKQKIIEYAETFSLSIEQAVYIYLYNIANKNNIGQLKEVVLYLKNLL